MDLRYFIIFILCIGIVSAGTVVLEEDFEDANNGQWNTYTCTRTTTQNSSGLYSMHLDSGQGCLVNQSVPVTGDYNIVFDLFQTSGGSPNDPLFSFMDSGCTRTGDVITECSDTNGILECFTGAAWPSFDMPSLETEWLTIDIMYYNGNESCRHRVNNETHTWETIQADCRAYGGTEPAVCYAFGEQGATPRTYIDNIKICDGECPAVAAPNNNIPVLSNINLTSGNAPQGDNTTPYVTNDTTPTFTFTTDINSNCSIGGLDQNYTDMGSTRHCAGGQETTAHTCTIIAADELSFGYNRNVSISCINILNPTNQTGSSTTGELTVHVRPTMNINITYFVDGVAYTNKTFSEGQDFTSYLNLTANGIIENSSTCNVTFVDGIVGTKANESFTLCNGCDYSLFPFLISDEASSEDTLRFFVCHNGSAQSKNLEIDVECGSDSYSETIANTGFSACSIADTEFIINLTVCADSTDVAVNFSNNAVLQSSHRITDLEYDREYAQDVTPATYNQTLSLYQLSHEHKYYIHGLKTVYGNCSNPNTVFNWNDTSNLVIEDSPPDIQHDFIFVDDVQYLFIDLVSLNGTNQSNITVFMTITDDDLDNHTINVYNSTHLIYNETLIGAVAAHSHLIPIDRFQNGSQTYNFTTIAYSGNLTSNLTTRFIMNISGNVPPSITLNLVDGYSSTLPFNVNYTPNDLGTISNCSLNSNLDGSFGFTSDDATINNGAINLFNISAGAAGLYNYSISCRDDGDLVGTSSLRTFNITAGVSPPTGAYNNSIIENTNWFNTDALDTTTTAGVLMYFFIFIIIVAIVVFAIYLMIPALLFFSGILIIIFGILVYANITAIFGSMIVLMGIFFMIWGVFQAKS